VPQTPKSAPSASRVERSSAGAAKRISPDDGSHTPLVAWEQQDPGTYVTQDTGRYLLWCSLAGHEAAGMATTLRVD
jgi:uncharacterized cupredoxin-like copper-binding protein